MDLGTLLTDGEKRGLLKTAKMNNDTRILILNALDEAHRLVNNSNQSFAAYAAAFGMLSGNMAVLSGWRNPRAR